MTTVARKKTEKAALKTAEEEEALLDTLVQRWMMRNRSEVDAAWERSHESDKVQFVYDYTVQLKREVITDFNKSKDDHDFYIYLLIQMTFLFLDGEAKWHKKR